MNSKLASIARIAVLMTAGSAAGAQTTPAPSLLENPLLARPSTTSSARPTERKSEPSKASASKSTSSKSGATKAGTAKSSPVKLSGETHAKSAAAATSTHSERTKSETKSERKSENETGAKTESKSEAASTEDEKSSASAQPKADDADQGAKKPEINAKSSTDGKAGEGSLSKPLLIETKADPPGSLEYGTVKTRESAMSAIGDGGRMIYTLFPMLIMLVGGMRLLANYHKKHGRLPGPLASMAQRSQNGAPMAPQVGNKANALSGLASGITKGFAVRKAANAPQSAIKLVETMSLGGANVHLVEVNGRSLLLGATSMNVSLLTEFEDEDEDARFNVLLEEANVQMQGVSGRSSDKAELLRAGMLRNDLSSATSSVENATRRLQALRGF